jgi:hypothetical protein
LDKEKIKEIYGWDPDKGDYKVRREKSGNEKYRVLMNGNAPLIIIFGIILTFIIIFCFEKI